MKDYLKQLFENAGVSLPNENSLGEKIIPDDDPVKLQNFWNWFGDSKVVDEQGRPLVVYHGTNNKFDTFDKLKIGSNAGFAGGGFYFSEIQESPSQYDEGTASSYGNNIIVAFINVKNPLTFDEKTISKDTYLKILNIHHYYGGKWESIYDEANSDGILFKSITSRDASYFKITPQERIEIFEELGFDGLKDDENHWWQVFESNQIKAVNNAGTFSSTSNNIYEATAYHGTPHSFNEFSLKHISTGEGVQVHGWGIYFTLDKEVARGYKYRLGKQKERQLENWENKILDDIRDYGFDEVVKNIKYSLEQCKKTNNKDGIKRYQTSLDFIDSLSIVDGMVLTVDIPNDDELIVEDDLLKNQPSKVKNIIINYVKELYGEQLNLDKVYDYYDQIHDFIREANIPDEQKEEASIIISYLFRSHLSDYKQSPDELFRIWNLALINYINDAKMNFEKYKNSGSNISKEDIEYYKNNIETGKYMHKNIKNFIDMMTTNGELDLYDTNLDYIMDNINGKKFYKKLSDYFIMKSKTKRNSGDCLASMWLLKQGVQGIKYHGELDGDCVVIFNPKRVKIIGKE